MQYCTPWINRALSAVLRRALCFLCGAPHLGTFMAHTELTWPQSLTLTLLSPTQKAGVQIIFITWRELCPCSCLAWLSFRGTAGQDAIQVGGGRIRGRNSFCSLLPSCPPLPPIISGSAAPPKDGRARHEPNQLVPCRRGKEGTPPTPSYVPSCCGNRVWLGFTVSGGGGGGEPLLLLTSYVIHIIVEGGVFYKLKSNALF